MRYGIYLSGSGETSHPLLLSDLAQEAEDAGWEGVFIWDHIGTLEAATDPWVALAAMAMRTSRVRLGTVVTPLARRRPWKLARETASLDHLSHGRLVLGVGLGWSDEEFSVFGEQSDPRLRAEKLDEGLEVLAGLWSGERFSYQGRHYQVREACFLPRPVQQPRIPIWPCGAWSSKRAPFRRAARWDGVIAICGTGEDRAIRPDEVRDIRAYIGQHRASPDPFDIVVILWSEGGRSAQDQEAVAQYTQAGATWWLEDVSSERFALPEARARIRIGPPG